jgi:hypothetical protein
MAKAKLKFQRGTVKVGKYLKQNSSPNKVEFNSYCMEARCEYWNKIHYLSEKS